MPKNPNGNLQKRSRAEGRWLAEHDGATTDPPVPRMAMPLQGAGRMKGGMIPLPPPTAPGVMPPEDSRLWFFVPKAVQRGEEWIQDDTREWFEERGRKVPIAREYIDHPRWVIGSAAETMRGKLYNGNIVSEVHLLARIAAGMSEFPAWVPARLSVKQAQADVAYRLTKLTRATLLAKGKEAMEAFAERAPGQFLKFVGATFVPKRLETEATVRADSMDAETADALIEALSAELERRANDARIIAAQGGNDWVEPVDPSVNLIASAREMHEAAGPKTPMGARVDPDFAAFTGRPKPPTGAEPEIVDIVLAEEADAGSAEFEWD